MAWLRLASHHRRRDRRRRLKRRDQAQQQGGRVIVGRIQARRRPPVTFASPHWARSVDLPYPAGATIAASGSVLATSRSRRARSQDLLTARRQCGAPWTCRPQVEALGRSASLHDRIPRTSHRDIRARIAREGPPGDLSRAPTATRMPRWHLASVHLEDLQGLVDVIAQGQGEPRGRGHRVRRSRRSKRHVTAHR